MPKIFFWLSKCIFLCPLHIAIRGSARKAVLAVAIFLLFFSSVASANNLSVTKAALVEKAAAGAGTVKIKFSVSWDNSWKDDTNNDAVWVFAKYCTANCSTTGEWHHATLKTSGINPTNFSRGSGTALDIVVPASDRKGAFLQRSGAGTGTVSTTGIKLVWDYAADGVSDADATGTNTRIKVFGIEMVYIPSGNWFVIGDNASVANFGYNGSPSSTNVYSEAELPFAASDANYYTSGGNLGEDATGASFTLPAAFPKGFAPFYMMKYEISQGQYRDFLNCLTRADQANRVAATITSDTITNTYVMSNATTVAYRNSIRAPASGNGDTNRVVFGCDLNANGTFNEPSDGEWIAMNFMSWMDLAAYADWAALRPMTELEFEKSARAAERYPLGGEYAWETTDLTQVASISAPGTNTEAAGNSGNGLAVYGNHASVQGALRVGFAASGSSNRVSSGASYYGAMELSGNVWERAVTVGNAAGRAFTGTHGDGALGTAGYATNSDWPGWSGGQVKDAWGSGLRGGDWIDSDFMATSNRRYAAYEEPLRGGHYGGRAVRTAE